MDLYRLSASVRTRRYQYRFLFVLLSLFSLGACSTAPKDLPEQVPASQVAERPVASEPATQQPSVAGPRYLLDPPSVGRSVSRPELLVAQDLVGALKQVPGYDVSSTVLRVPTVRTNFARAVVDVLVSEGYQVERVSAKSGRGVILSSVIKQRDNRNNGGYTFILAVDRVALKRSYTLRGEFIAPASSLYVRGADYRAISLNDDIFVSRRQS